MPEKHKRMLVIDDELIVLDSCRRVFADRGFEVVTTDRAREGLEMVGDEHFDVVLCDWKMPELNGIDVVEMLDKRSPDSAVVMISGFPAVERATEAMKRGAMDYIAKPFTPEEIVQAVDRALRRKEQQKREGEERLARAVRAFRFPVPSLEDKTPQTIAETVAQKVGVGKTTSPWLSVLVLGVLAGAYIGFGGLLAGTVTFDMAAHLGVGFTKFMSGAVFSLGLMLVIIAGAELFTGNNLMISSALSREITVGKMLGRWTVVYGANFIGALVVAALFVLSGLWRTAGQALGAAALRTAYAKVNLGFGAALVRGIGCNWLVCLAVWMALAARQTIGKIFAIFFPIMGFVAIGFEHCVANMYFIPAGLFLRDWAGVATPEGFARTLTWGSFLFRNLLPVTLGNIIGGAVFVGMSYWGAYLRGGTGAGPATAASRGGGAPGAGEP